jgi:probable rRNA maturation factor
VNVAWSVPRRFLSDRAVREAVRAALRHGDRPEIDVDVALVSDAELASIHGRFLDDPSETDVISFDLGEGDDGPAAEIYVSVERAVEVARRRDLPTARELRLYVVHGALHLCGFDDHERGDRARMRRAESAVLDELERSRSKHDGTRGPISHRKTKKR